MGPCCQYSRAILVLCYNIVVEKIVKPYATLGIVPGNVLQFDTIRELVAFETLLAGAIDPQLNDARDRIWNDRDEVSRYLKPPKFIGSFLNIALTVMPNPYERIVDARSRGWKMYTPGRFERDSDLNRSTIEYFTGFCFTAIAKTTGKPAAEVVEAEMWYYPTTNTRLCLATDPDKQRPSNHNGPSIQRTVTKPRLKPIAGAVTDPTLQKLGFATLWQRAQQAKIDSQAV